MLAALVYDLPFLDKNLCPGQTLNLNECLDETSQGLSYMYYVLWTIKKNMKEHPHLGKSLFMS